MARPLAPWTAVLLALVTLVAGGIAGYVLHGASPGPPAAGSGSPILSITAAGTLGTAFPTLADRLANESPGVASPVAAQQYEGSLAALNAIAQLHQRYDVAAAADFRLIPRLLYPADAAWQVVFATDPEVLVYDPSAAPLAGINASNWPAAIVRSGVVLGVANASTDPNGYNGIFVLELAGLALDGSAGALYGHFYAGAPGAFATVNPSTAREELETQIAPLLAAHVLQASFTYRSYAVVHGLAYVPLDPAYDLGATDPASVARYANASTEILAANGSLARVTGAPLAFAATVPTSAPNPDLGALFVHLLVSPEGAAVLAEEGFVPVAPAWSQGPGPLPALLAPMTVPLPTYLAAEI